jgi:tight adherence protein C
MLLLLVFAVLLLAVAGYLVSEVVTQPGRERHSAIRRAATYGRMSVAAPGLDRLHFRQRVLVPATASMARFVLRLNPRVTHESISFRLLAAGMGRSLTATTFLAIQGAATIVGGVFGFVFGVALLGGSMALLMGVGMAALGFIIPGFVVSRRARSRRDELRAQLPDALDLLAVSVEAGLAFDGAVAKLTEHMEGALAEEFSHTLGEMRIGESRHDALKKLSDRADSPEVSSFTRAIIQADQLGISLGRLLRVQASESRLKRQAAAEEKAAKSPIKMLFPTVIFIFPAMFIVILGPAMLNLMTIF